MCHGRTSVNFVGELSFRGTTQVRSSIDKSSKSIYHPVAPLMLRLCSSAFEVIHHRDRHVPKELSLYVREAIPWLVVEHTVGTDVDASGRGDWYTCIKPCFDPTLYKRATAKRSVLAQIVDDMNKVRARIRITAVVCIDTVDGGFLANAKAARWDQSV